MYSIKIKRFEGPADLLLKMIEEKKLSVTEISLREVTDQYLAHLDNLTTLPKEELAEFLVVAASLILMKSKSLIPMLNEPEPEDPEEFSLYLKKQEEIKILMNHLSGIKTRSFLRDAYDEVLFAPGNVSLGAIKRTFEDVLAKKEKELDKTYLEERKMDPKITVAQKIQEICEVLKMKKILSFSSYIENSQKEEIIASFLAMLEIIERSVAEFDQEANFGEIKLKILHE